MVEERDNTTPENGHSRRRPYLESLTTFDLIKIADGEGIDIPPGLDRIFIIEELLEAWSEDGEDIPEEPEMMDTVLVESVPLPKQYSITFIEAIVRDPLWAFVFWEVKSQEKEEYEKCDSFNGYYLRVSPLNNGIENTPEGNEEKFTVPIGNDDTTWYIGFSPEFKNQGRYMVELCVDVYGRDTVLAASNPFKVPGLPEPPSQTEKKENGGLFSNPLMRLSGYGDFAVLNKMERMSRSKRSVL